MKNLRDLLSDEAFKKLMNYTILLKQLVIFGGAFFN